ncbi:MAG: hypothetical protein OXI02_00970 [Candidatus Dadabacteria bacterium]|nr:hypothetical protein [Candidatus Dadabacteria bacterium]MDE0476623.1 hypothetical protein [Candidatus Dadabacteria bacterium]
MTEKKIKPDPDTGRSIKESEIPEPEPPATYSADPLDIPTESQDTGTTGDAETPDD